VDEINHATGRPRGRGAGAAVLFASAAIGLAACNALTTNSNEAPRPPDAFERVRAIDLTPRFPLSTDQGSAIGERTPQAATYPGNASDGVQMIEGAQLAPSGEGYELNFENTPLTTVAKVILGDILGVGYTIDSRVQGTVSLSSGRPVPKADVLYVLESTLRMSNVGLARDTGGGYRLIPLAEATGTGSVDVAGAGARPEPGYGVTVLPLHYVSAATLIKLLDSFAVRPGMVRSEPTRNLLVIQGTGAERRSAVETALNFDVDWMRGQSVGIYPVRNSNPETVIAELEKIMETGEGGLGQNLVKLQPILRLNAVLVVTRKTELLRRTAIWISRLDQADTQSTGVRVYRVRYGDARQIANVLNEVFVGRSSGAGTFDSATNQIAPGSGLTSLSSSSAGGLSGGMTPPPGIWGSGGATPATPGQVLPGGAGTAAGGTFGGPVPARGSGVAGFGAFGAGGGTGGPAVLPNVRISADVANNSLLIYASHENYRIIERTLREVDRPQLQVSIDATIAEITLNDSLRYGVQYFLRSQDIGLRPNKGSIGFNIGTSQPLSRILPGFNFLLGSENDPQLVLDAIRTVSTVKVLSAPSVVVVDNQVATLLVGDQIPIATRTATLVESPNLPVVNNIDYRNTGVILRVQPRINQNGNVLLDIEQEISNVAAAAGTGATLTPTVSQRKVKSSIAVASGQTVLLGGLISERVEKGRDTLPIPGLEKLNIINDLLSHNTGAVNRTELIMFIRPQIIRDGTDAYLIAEQLRTKLTGSLGTSPLVRSNGSPAPR
jgi:general secretion pathway protein D